MVRKNRVLECQFVGKLKKGIALRDRHLQDERMIESIPREVIEKIVKTEDPILKVVMPLHLQQCHPGLHPPQLLRVTVADQQ